MSLLCLDCGNTRLKWGWRTAAGWQAQGALPLADLAALAELTARFPRPEQVMLSNVAGQAAAEAIAQALAPWQQRVQVVQSCAAAGGVRNGYARPEQLGVDRWCALIGAHAVQAGDCLVVGAGTATTIDSLRADGLFLGGLILPGFDLMRRSLARDTAALPLVAGEVATWPQCTEDAIFSGCLQAQLGAIERAYAALAERQGQAPACLLFGGVAPVLADALPWPVRCFESLVLEGLAQLGAVA